MSLISIITAIVVGGAAAAGGWYLRHTLLTRQLYTTRKRFEEQQALHMTLQHEITSLREKLFDKDYKNTDKRQVESKLSALQADNQELSIQLQTLKSKSKKKQKSILEKTSREIENITYKKDHEITVFRQKLETILKERDDLHDQCSNYQTGIDKSRKRSEMLERQYNIQRAEIANFKTRVAKLQRRLANFEKSPDPVSFAKIYKKKRQVATDRFQQRSREPSTDRFEHRQAEEILEVDTTPKTETPIESTEKKVESNSKQTTKFAARKRKDPKTSGNSKKSGSAHKKRDISSTGMRMLQAFEKEIRGTRKKPKS